MPRCFLALAAILAVGTISLSSCAGTPASDATPIAPASAHGSVAGAAEMSEPPLALLSMNDAGDISLLDLLTGDSEAVAAVDAPVELASDGRYAFITTERGLSIVDSGRWSWDHGDHFHYYLAAPRTIGTLAGSGDATVTTGLLSTAGSTGVFFAGSGEAVLLDNAALADGDLVEVFRLDVTATSGIVAPLADGALVSDGDELVWHDADGAAGTDRIACVTPEGTITTNVGVVVGCADGAVLATWDDGALAVERIPFPTGVATERATDFAGRKGRPTVAALAGDRGFWLLDTREREWTFVATATPLVRVSAVDDVSGSVVALDADGRVHVYSGAGGTPAMTEPLMSEVTDTVSLTVDGQRAYINDPGGGVVHEIDYADGARVARTLQPPAPAVFTAEVGR